MNFVFLFNCQVEFSNLYQSYFQKGYLLQTHTIFFLTNCYKGISKGFIQTTAMDKIQVEEMADFFSQKIIYEEISAVLKGIYPNVRGYSVNPTEQLCKKMEFLPRSFNAMCQQ